MNEVGSRGRGESVWLTWFAVSVLNGFIPLAEYRGDKETQALCRKFSFSLMQAVENAWDGEWYLRGWYDDGTSLGSKNSEECQIDSIPQSWAVLTGGERERGKTALRSALNRLFDRKTGLIKLFDPPFNEGIARPGYIRGYLPGIRENGGQYTHAAAWLALASFQLGWTDNGLELLHALLPTSHPTGTYLAEPYVLAGDVYAHPDQLGRGGWSWYTGAAGWYHQAALQGLLGMRVKDGHLFIEAKLPSGWTGWSACWKTETGTLHINVRRGKKEQCVLDREPVGSVSLKGLNGEHRLEITVPPEN